MACFVCFLEKKTGKKKTLLFGGTSKSFKNWWNNYGKHSNKGVKIVSIKASLKKKPKKQKLFIDPTEW